MHLVTVTSPGAGGRIEFPDCRPLVGNLDEVALSVVLLRCLERLGWTGVAG